MLSLSLLLLLCAGPMREILSCVITPQMEKKKGTFFFFKRCDKRVCSLLPPSLLLSSLFGLTQLVRHGRALRNTWRTTTIYSKVPSFAFSSFSLSFSALHSIGFLRLLIPLFLLILSISLSSTLDLLPMPPFSPRQRRKTEIPPHYQQWGKRGEVERGAVRVVGRGEEG